MSTSAPYQVVYRNQLQFNLGVPLTAQNLAVQFSRPSPIFVERIGGQHGLPATVVAKQTSGPEKNNGDSVFNYSTLSQDKMEMMSQLAKRDLRNRRLQAQMSGNSPSSESLSPTPSPSRTRLYQKNSFERFARQEVIKPRKPLTAKEADKNRRLGAVQTPPPRKPVTHFRRDDYFTSARNASVSVTTNPDVFFPTKPEGSHESKDEIERLQQEAEGYLSLIERIQEGAISEPGVRFLHPPVKGNRKDEFLMEEENLDRVRIRIEEQNTRLTRNLYNLKLKAKQLQHDAVHLDVSRPPRKNQILSQLGIVLRGVVKALQTFVNQLPYQDLKEGLPSHCQELSALLRQLVTLSAAVKQGKQSDGDCRLLAVLDRVDNLNMKWSIEPKKVCFQTDKKDQKSVVIKDWVSDTKVDKNIFVIKSQPEFKFLLEPGKMVSQAPRQAVQRGRPKKRTFGKENKHFGAASATGNGPVELRSAAASLLQSKSKVTGTNGREHTINSGIAWDARMGRQLSRQAHMKGYLLPHDLMVKRETAQRAVALSNQDRRYADSTIAVSLKKSPSRPYSAPANARHKGVNFELDRQSSMPWIPPGRSARSRSLSSEPKSRSRSPFYLREMDSEETGHMFPDKHLPVVKMADGNVVNSEYQSLPTDKKLRSADVSNSFIDEVEHRLLRRLMGRQAENNNKTSRSSAGFKLSQRKETASADVTGDVSSDLDEPLDATDLGEEIRQEAVSAVDAPTIESMKQRLAEMQREQREIRQRWSTLKFIDTQPKTRIFTSSDIQSDRFLDPPAIEVTGMSKSERPYHSERSIIKEWSEEPVIFTKPSIGSKVRYLHTVDHQTQNNLRPEPLLAQLKKPKRLVTLKQTAVERIVADREKFESYLKKRSHHPSGKFDPWKLVEEISDEILSDCLAGIVAEVETINEEIANHMYKSEFMVDTRDPDTMFPKEPADPFAKPVGAGDSYGHDRRVAAQLPLVKKASEEVASRFIGGKRSVLGQEDQQHAVDEEVNAEDWGNLRGQEKLSPLRSLLRSSQKMLPQRSLSKSPEKVLPQSGLLKSPEKVSPQSSLSMSPEKMSPQRSLSKSLEKRMSQSTDRFSPQRSSSKSPEKMSPQRSSSKSPEKMSPQRSSSKSPEKMSPQRSSSKSPEKMSPQRSLSKSLEEMSPQRSLSKSLEDMSPIVLAAEPLLENVSYLLPHNEDVYIQRKERGAGDVQREEIGGGDVKIEGGKKNDDEYEDDYEESSKAASSKGGDDNENDKEEDDDYGLDDFEDVSDDELKDVKYDESEDVSNDESK